MNEGMGGPHVVSKRDGVTKNETSGRLLCMISKVVGEGIIDLNTNTMI